MPATAPDADAESYDRYREGQARKSRLRSESGREIGALPAIVDAERRNRCLDNFRLFCETYFPERFPWPWGRDHLQVLEILGGVVIEGGQFPLAMPRGSGKTTISTCAVLFAVLYGHRRFVVFIASTAKVANERLDDLIRDELETNELLAQDFPEACFPVRRLERNTTRAKMQTLEGNFTRLGWGAGELRLATIPGSPCSGAVIVSAGLTTGDIRGLLRRSPDGSLDRPDLVICDDPQTDESARMPGQCDTREALISGAILGLAGPGKKIAVVVPCTVIRPNDLSDRLLDRKRNPGWHGRKFKLVDKMPDKMELWEQYADLLRQGQEQTPPTRMRANAFYSTNRAAMDAGADLSWPDRKEPDTLSALQHAMDLFFLKPAVFAAEYQNEPLEVLDSGGAEPIDPTEAAGKLNKVPRGVVPMECSRLVAFIDPKQEIIFWAVVGWDEKFGGAVVDYGTFPRQQGSRFSGTDPMSSLSMVYRDQKFSLEARLYAALTATANEILSRTWPRADEGEPMKIDKCLVDANWGPHTELIHQWCRQSPHGVIVPSVGKYIGAAKTPFSEWSPKPGDIRGDRWRMRTSGSRFGKFVLFDTNYWKTFVAERVRSAVGSPGSLYLFGSNPGLHSLFCDHLAAEHPKRVEVDGRIVDEWIENPGRPDNDYLDCLVGCAVAASVLGLKWSASVAAGGAPEVRAPKPKLSYAAQRAKLDARDRGMR